MAVRMKLQDLDSARGRMGTKCFINRVGKVVQEKALNVSFYITILICLSDTLWQQIYPFLPGPNSVCLTL